MNFLAPMAFWFLASIPILIVFYLLKRKRVSRVVPSTLLWQKFLAESQASAPFQRLRHNWLLILQILLLLLAILALARPYFSSKVTGGRIIVAILDASASMQSTDESPSRFEKARKEALKLVDSIHDNDQMVVLQASANTEVRQSPTSEKSALRRAIESAQPTDSPTRLAEALKLAQTLIQNNNKAEVHLFSDGASPSLNEFENKGLPLIYHQTGTRGANLGIVNLEVRQHPENPAQRAVFTTVANTSSNQMETQVELHFGDTLIEVKPLNLTPKQSAPIVFVANQENDGIFTVKLTTKDDLVADNQASVVSLLPRPVKVLLITAGNKFLEKALKAVPNVQLGVLPALTEPATGFDFVVLDNVVPVVWPEANVMTFNVSGTNWFTSIGKIETPALVDWKTAHPLLRFVNFDNVQVGEAMLVPTPTWGVPILESPQTSLIIAGEIGRQRVLWVGFDSVQSTWPLRISFPIFIANAVEWLNPASVQAAQMNIKAGIPFRLGLTEDLPTVDITMPDGTTRSRAIDQTRRELVFGDTIKQGVYSVKAGTNQFRFAVNLLDAAESDTAPRPEVQFGEFARAAASATRQASLEFWRWIALAALLICMFEWWWYHKRTA
jgi:Ca-activated chloride channel homolog